MLDVRRRVTRENETREESYGRGEILNEFSKENPKERELWSTVIFQAIVNIRFKVSTWQQDLAFLKGAGNFKWICDQLDLDYKKTSEAAIRYAMDGKRKIILKH